MSLDVDLYPHIEPFCYKFCFCFRFNILKPNLDRYLFSILWGSLNQHIHSLTSVYHLKTSYRDPPISKNIPSITINKTMALSVKL